jgi:Xaa-Pro aminopeptidase
MVTMDSKRLFLAQRVDAFRDLLRERKLDGFLLTHLSDLYYFTDYQSEGYYGLIGLQESWLLLPNLLFEQGKASTYGFNCVQGRFFPTLESIVKKNKLKKIGFDPNQLPYAFGAALVKMGFVPVSGLIN